MSNIVVPTKPKQASGEQTNGPLIILPTVGRKAIAKNPRRIVIYSNAKHGKTSIVTGLDSYCILDTEKGADFLDDVFVLPVEDAQTFIRTTSEIVKQGRPYKHIVVDTVTSIDFFIQPLAVHMLMKTPMGKNFQVGDDILGLPHGGGWYWIRKAYMELLNRAYRARGDGGSLIILAHLQEKIIEKKGKETSASDINLPGKLKNIIASTSDAIGFFYRREDKGYITFKTKDENACGTRCKHLRGKEFLISELKEDETLDTFWENIYINE